MESGGSFKNNVYFKFVTSNCSNDLYVVEYGYEDFSRSTQKLKPRIQPDLLVHFVMDGKGAFFLDGKRYDIGKNTLFFIPSGRMMNYAPDPEEPWRYYWIAFGGLKAVQFCERAKLSAEKPVYVFHHPERVDELFGELFAINENTFSSDFYALSVLYRLFGMLVDERNTAIPDLSNIKERYAQLTVDYIEAHYSDPHLRVEDIAQAIHISHVYLCKVFNAVMGTTVMKYLIAYRIRRASELLMNEKLPIKTIAEMVGYQNQMHFSSAFKKRFGISPKYFKSTGAF